VLPSGPVSAASQHQPAAQPTSAPGTVPAAVTVRALDKTFKVPHQQASTLKERVLHPFRSATSDTLEALREVSVEVPRGEFFGIVGRNGSGKSTLLKCLAGIYEPTAGSVDVQGRLGTFIELGVGFNPELAARDNVIVNATMLGLTRGEAAARFERILEFAELQEFRDLRLKNYSSGMHVRLAFSTAVQIDADVLLVDEVLAVGDAAFQQKCYEEFRRLKDEGRTILFVTHDMAAVERFCDRAMLLERGRVVAMGDPQDIGRRYHELNFNRPELAADQAGEERYGSRAAEILSVWFETADGAPTQALVGGEPAAVCLEVWVREEVDEPTFSVGLANDAGLPVFVASSEFQEGLPARLEAGARYVVRLEFDCLLASGRYACTPGLSRGGRADDLIDLRPDFASVLVHAVRPSLGLADLPHRFTVQSR
jgi:ABC-type polysaccharide/polyol phosphate transport system ATPase subunit